MSSNASLMVWPLVSGLLTLVATSILGVGAIMAWCLFLEGQPSTTRTRGLMLRALACIVAVEIWLVGAQRISWQVFVALSFCNAWGGLEAVLHFPRIHGARDFFSIKQATLLLAKAACYALGTKDGLSAMILNVLILPVLYSMALPWDVAAGCRQLPAPAGSGAGDAEDADIAVLLFRWLVTRTGRRRLAISFLRSLQQTLWPCDFGVKDSLAY